MLMGDVENTTQNTYKPSLGDGALVTVQTWEPAGPQRSGRGGMPGSRRVPRHPTALSSPGGVVGGEERWRGTRGRPPWRQVLQAHAFWLRLTWAVCPLRPSHSQTEPRKPCGRRNVYCSLNH